MIEYQYIDRNNIIDLLLKADGSAVDLSSVTKIDLIIGSTIISDSTSGAYPIKWTDNGTTGKIRIKIGSETGISKGIYTTIIVIYDSSYPDGLRWGETFKLNIKSV